MSRLVLGTAQFGLSYGIANQTGQVTRREAKMILQLAATNGIGMLDTAIAYGESETYLGEIGVLGFEVVTKLPALPNSCSNVYYWIREQVATSLSRLGIRSLYGLLLHRPEQLLGSNGKELYRALQDLKDVGHVKKIGISIYSPDELELLIPQYRFDLVQAPFNLVDRRLHTTGWLQRLKDEGIEIHTRSVFLQGLLLMPQAAMLPKFATWNDLWVRWHQWLSTHATSAVQACLALPLSFPEIDHIVVGADSVSQLGQIISAAVDVAPVDLPNLSCDAENLVNPAQWRHL